MIIRVNKTKIIFISRFFPYIMLFWLNLFDFFNFFFSFFDLNFSILVGFYDFYFFSELLKVTLLIMLLNSENSDILYFFLFGVGSRLVSIILVFLIFYLIDLLWNGLLLLLLLHWLLLLLWIMIINHILNFLILMLIIFLPQHLSFVTVRQWRVIHISNSIVELALYRWFILVILVHQTTLSCEVRWSLKAWLISVDIDRLASLCINSIMVNFTSIDFIVGWIWEHRSINIVSGCFVV